MRALRGRPISSFRLTFLTAAVSLSAALVAPNVAWSKTVPKPYPCPTASGCNCSGSTSIASTDANLCLLSAPGASDPSDVVCTDANGQELCGFQLEVSFASGYGINSFIPANSSILFQAVTGAGGFLKLNWVANGGAAMPSGTYTRLGQISVSSDIATAEPSAGAGSLAVDASLDLVSIDHGTIAVPEPESEPLLLMGLIALSLLAGARARRGGLLAVAPLLSLA